MAARRRRIGDALAALAGARPDLLEAAPGARARFVALGGVLLSTGGLAVLSAAFAVHMALGAWWPVTLQIFHKEIDSQVVALQAEASDAYQKSLDTDARFAGLDALRAKVAEEQATVA